MTTPMFYIGLRPCGCAVQSVTGEGDPWTANSVAEMIRRGLSVERVDGATMRQRFAVDGCPHGAAPHDLTGRSYVAIEPGCGCLTAAVGASASRAPDVVREWIVAGCHVELVADDVVRQRFGRCPHGETVRAGAMMAKQGRLL